MDQVKKRKLEKVADKLRGKNTDAANGIVNYTIATGDFDKAGNYIAEIEITFGSGQILTFTNILITVLPKIPATN